MIPGSSPPPFYALDLLSVAPSSTHSLCAVYSLLVCLWLAGIVKNYVFFFQYLCPVLIIIIKLTDSQQLPPSNYKLTSFSCLSKLFVKCCKTLQHTVSVHTHSYPSAICFPSKPELSWSHAFYSVCGRVTREINYMYVCNNHLLNYLPIVVLFLNRYNFGV